MEKIIFLLIAFLTPGALNAQNGFESWDKNYNLVDVSQVLKNEKEYAEKIESDPDIAQYYVAMASFRFLARYTGRTRELSTETSTSMKNVLKIKTGSSKVLDGLVSKEFEFKINDSTLWLPIQNPLIKPFLEEVNKDQVVLLYTLFTNEHKYEGGYINTFLISEFTTQWTE